MTIFTLKLSTMKKLIAFVVFLCISVSVNAQFLSYGIKAGLNYNVNGDLRAYNNGVEIDELSSNEEVGYHFGLLAEIKLPLFLYIRPELLYTHTESSYQGSEDQTKLKTDRIDLPVLLGLRVLKIGRIFLGPSFQYALNTDLTDTENIDNIKNISSDDFVVAGQVGIGLDFGRFGGDIRWETGFTQSEAEFIGDNIDIGDTELLVDTQNQQFLISIYYKFNK